MKTPVHLLVPLGLLTLTLPARAFTASEDFSSYSTPTTFSGANLAGAAGAGTAGTGAAGNGWLNGWRSASSTVTAGAQVINTSPVNSGGNYLSGTFTSNSTGTTADSIALGRAYDVTGGSLAGETSLYINFDFRADSVPSTMRYDIFENLGRATGATSASFNFRTVGGFWNTIAGTGSTLTATTMAFNAGTTYSFAIVLNPVNATWSYSISDGTASVSASSLGFRVASFDTDATAGSAGGRWFEVVGTETTNVLSQTTTFSLDNLSISTSAIPEPSACALLVGATVLGLVSLRRRLIR